MNIIANYNGFNMARPIKAESQAHIHIYIITCNSDNTVSGKNITT